MCRIMALHLGPSFVSYLQPAVETVQSCSQYFHEDVRAAAILSTVQLAASFAVSAVTPQSTGAVTVPQGWAAAAAQAPASPGQQAVLGYAEAAWQACLSGLGDTDPDVVAGV